MLAGGPSGIAGSVVVVTVVVAVVVVAGAGGVRAGGGTVSARRLGVARAKTGTLDEVAPFLGELDRVFLDAWARPH